MPVVFSDNDDKLLRQEQMKGNCGQDAHYHLARARFLMTVDTGLVSPSPYFYAALEYRFCIERFLFTLLVLVSGEDSVTRSHEKLYTGSSLRAAVNTIEPDLHKKLQYTDLMLTATNQPLRTAKPDLALLSKSHGQLGGYLHAQTRPPETTWSDRWCSNFLTFLESCDSNLGELLAPDKVLSGFIPRGEVYAQWREGKLSDDQVIKKMKNEFMG